MKNQQLLFILVAGVAGLGLLYQHSGDRLLVGVLGAVLLLTLVYWSRRKGGLPARDLDLCLSLAHILHAETPRPERDNHLVFFWQPARSVCVAWSGRFLNQVSAFSLSPRGQAAVSQLFDELQQYHEQNRMARWNIAHFSLAPNRQRFNLSYDYSEDLAEQNLHPGDYVRRFM